MPISELMYQPLKGAAGNSRPPTSSSMLDTAGRAYQRRPRAANHSSLGASGLGQGPTEPLPGAPSRDGLTTPPCPFHAHVGCSRGTSRTSSGGRVKSSGGSSGAWSSKGSTSKRLFPGVQPCWTQSWVEWADVGAGAPRGPLRGPSGSSHYPSPPFTSGVPHWLDFPGPGYPLSHPIFHLKEGLLPAADASLAGPLCLSPLAPPFSVPTSVISTLAGSPRTEPSCCL